MTEVIDPQRAALARVAAELGLKLSATAYEGLLRYLGLLMRWNAVYNLTAVRDPSDMLTQHLADCLAVIGPLGRFVAPRAAPRVLDVGSGGGLPGAVIALVAPGWQVVCVDAVGKKAAFIRQVAVELHLKNLHAQHARVESLPPGGFDVVASRAFSSLADFTRLTRRHLAPDGAWMAMKGRPQEAELKALPANVELFHVEPLHVPGLLAERCLIWMKPKPAEGEGSHHARNR